MIIEIIFRYNKRRALHTPPLRLTETLSDIKSGVSRHIGNGFINFNISAKTVDFGFNGFQGDNSKFDSRRVRPVRAF